ncbi:uncharacterized protein ARMOST_03056 [Armillaria ostoyae]|uniref:Uncharacterized protein n=1 Tax=Armillaria ostoyae TaxID=47428 RepID=A0A284QTD3_ARMOS|nr:uncharacterized protein ARMOST_03056 [Armillaria ostoyae]
MEYQAVTFVPHICLFTDHPIAQLILILIDSRVTTSPRRIRTADRLDDINRILSNDGRLCCAEHVEVINGGESLTADKLEKCNQLEGQPEKKNVRVGYKNILSVDAITLRFAIKTRALRIDGLAKPPEGPKMPGVPMKVPEVKFPYTPASNSQLSTATDGTFSPSTESNDYEAGLTVIGEFNTVEDFFPYFNWLKTPLKFEHNSNYLTFTEDSDSCLVPPIVNAFIGSSTASMLTISGRNSPLGFSQSPDVCFR